MYFTQQKPISAAWQAEMVEHASGQQKLLSVGRSANSSGGSVENNAFTGSKSIVTLADAS